MAVCLSALLGVQPATAFANDDLIRGVIGLGTAIMMNEAGKNQRQPRGQQRRNNQRRATANDSAEIVQQRAEIQRRLNALGFNAGEPDGAFGPQTRRAIAAFQQSLGRNPDGKLSSTEIAELYRLNEANGFAAYQGDGQDEATGFAALGAPGEQTAGSGAFPPLANAAPDGGQGTGMPTLGAPAEQPAGGGFPTLGAAPGQTAAAGAFPTLGAPAATAAGPSMPVIGAAPAQPTTAFPTIAAAPPTDTSMPTVAAAPEGAAPAAMPPLSPGVAPMAESEEITLDGELARTRFASREAQPAVHGVSLGHSAKDATARFEAAGFTGCAPDVSPLRCVRSAASLTDTISVWADKDDAVWALLRTITFKKPAPADLVKQQFKASFPRLYDAPGHVVGTGPHCGIHTMPVTTIEPLISETARYLGSTVTVIPEHVVALAQQCPLTYFVALDDNAATIGSVTIGFFDLSGIHRQIQAQRLEEEAAEDAVRGKLEQDLKL